MTVFSAQKINRALAFMFAVIVRNSIEETVAIVQPTGYKCMNRFLSTVFHSNNQSITK